MRKEQQITVMLPQCDQDCPFIFRRMRLRARWMVSPSAKPQAISSGIISITIPNKIMLVNSIAIHESRAMRKHDILKQSRVPPGEKIRLKDYDSGWRQTKELRLLGKDEVKARAKAFLDKTIIELAEAQELLFADDTYSILIILQAMDAAGKDGTIKHVMSGVNPQGCQVFSFKKPSAEELNHNFLWRYARSLPERGRIRIFNRSYYEDVLVVKVHPEILELGKLPPGKRGKSFWQERYHDINAFEQHLVRNGTSPLKFFLNLPL